MMALIPEASEALREGEVRFAYSVPVEPGRSEVIAYGLTTHSTPRRFPLEYRFRQPITVGHDTPTRSAISVLDTPSAMEPLRISVKRIPETSSGEEPELVLNLSFLVSSA
jgi:hypothetical protein